MTARFKILLLLFLWNMSVFAQLSPERMDSAITSVLKNVKAVGACVSVVKGDSIIYSKAFGLKDIEKGIPLNTTDIFRIASISKTFVATAIMQLVEKRKISLDDDAQNYLKFKLRNPSYPDTPISIRMLLSHLSSINDSQSRFKLNNIRPDKNEYYFKSYNNYPPGTKYSYCNYNYTILGAIIENVSGERFDNYIERHITSPLNLEGSFNCNHLDSTRFVKLYRYRTDTGLFQEDDEAYRPYTIYFNDKYRLGESTGLVYPCSGMKITADNLARYMIMHMYGGKKDNTRIISEKSEEIMRIVQPKAGTYALSFREYKNIIPGVTMYGQTGFNFGLRSAMIFDPEKKLGFVIICNGSDSEFIDGSGDMHYPIIRSLYSIIAQ